MHLYGYVRLKTTQGKFNLTKFIHWSIKENVNERLPTDI